MARQATAAQAAPPLGSQRTNRQWPEPEWAQDAAFVAAGSTLAASLRTSAPAVSFDCRAALGRFVELYGRTERSTGFFAHLRALHEAWDGVTDPVRERAVSPVSRPDRQLVP